MIQNLTKLYEGANVSGAVPNLIYIPILFDCDLTEVDVLTDAAVSGANAVFSLSKNGVIIPAAAAQINTGAKIGSVTGLDVALVKGDEIVLNLASGAVSSPLTLNLVTDDGKKLPNFRSLWNMATEYSPNDVVMAGGNSYIALTTNTNQPPEINADDWEIFVAKGEDGINGTDGSVIRNGAGAPADALGLNGDYYINTTNYNLHYKAAGVYSFIGNIKGADGEGGAGVPQTLFQEDFSSGDGAFDALKWTNSDSGNTQTGGRARITRAAGANGYIRSVPTFDVINQELIAEITTAATNSNCYTQLIMGNSGLGIVFSMNYLNGNLTMHSRGVDVGAIAYNSTNHRWWKISFIGLSVTYSASPNGADWTIIGVATNNTGLWFPMYAWLRMVNNSGSTAYSEYDNVSVKTIV